MRKVLSLFVLASLLLMVGFASAKVGSVDEECIANGFDFGIEKYQCGYTAPEKGSAADDYDITVTWFYDDEDECSAVEWTANPGVNGVLSKEATITYGYDGGLSGTVYQAGQNAISHVTFCGHNPEVPEFGVIVATLTVMGALGAFFVVRRK